MKLIIEEAIEFFNKNRDHGFTSSDQAIQCQKLLEEVGEFIRAIWSQDIEHAEAEVADVLGLLIDILNVRGANPRIDLLFRKGLDKLYTPEHTAKRNARLETRDE